jgi:hypothetical protein
LGQVYLTAPVVKAILAGGVLIGRKGVKAMPNWVISMGVSALIELARDPNMHSKWRGALLKVMREIARAFKDDSEFLQTAKQEFKA